MENSPIIKNNNTPQDKSTAMIHEIVEDHGSQDNRRLMIDLKNLRKQVIVETHHEYRGRVKEIRVAIEAFPTGYYNE
ncbi:hypothetical protein ES707_11017 [subsurface metagenome]